MIEIDQEGITALNGTLFEDNDGQQFVLKEGVVFRVSQRITAHRKKEIKAAEDLANANEPISSP